MAFCCVMKPIVGDFDQIVRFRVFHKAYTITTIGECVVSNAHFSRTWHDANGGHSVHGIREMICATVEMTTDHI